MMTRQGWMAGALALASACAMPVSMAQDEAGEEAVETILRPRPAEIRPLAAESLLLDVVNTGQRLVAVGDRGHILLSANGNDWAQTEVPVRSALTAVAFAPDGQAGWAVGHDAVILRTEDGGKTWVLQNFEPELELPFLDLLVIDAQSAIVVGAYGELRKTVDGGATWEAVDAPEIREEEVHFNSIVRLASGALFIAGESGMLGYSLDDGDSWTRLESPYDSSFFGAVPSGAQGVLIYGLRGTLYVNDDPVNNPDVEGWIEIGNENIATMFGGTRLQDGRVVLVGLNGTVTLVEGARLSNFKSAKGTPLSAVVEFGDGLLTVGESGIQRSALTN